MNQEKSLTPIVNKESAISEPVIFDPQRDIDRATQAAKSLMVVVDRTKPLVMNGKKYLYFEHWQTIGKFFQHTVGTEWTRPIKLGDKIMGWEAKSVAYDRDGRVVGGAEAACMRDERNWQDKPEFQLRSMAQTRAMSKALRSIFGFIPVLVGFESTPAEEMTVQSSPKQTVQTVLPKPNIEELEAICPSCGNVLLKIAGTSKKGKPYVLYACKDKEVCKFSTFSRSEAGVDENGKPLEVIQAEEDVDLDKIPVQ